METEQAAPATDRRTGAIGDARTRQLNQLRNRHAALAWWLQVHQRYPLGVVSIPTAARVLGVTRNRIRTLIEEKRFTVIAGMPNGSSYDQFIPIAELVAAPFEANRGRPGMFGPSDRNKKPPPRKKIVVPIL